jgi:predicted  nucleic acid-binding Zn-ribbon protein
MIASLRGYGRIARTVLAVIGGLLFVGIVGSFLMSYRAADQARAEIASQAATIAESSLSLAFSPDDLDGPVSPERAVELAGQVQSIVVDPSEFTDVTVFSPEGTILYSTAQSLIGTQMPGERERIREALRGVPQVRHTDGTVAVMVPMELRSGVGEPATVELVRPDNPVAAAPGPWRTNAVFLLAMLVLLGVAVFGVARVLAVVTDQQEAVRVVSATQQAVGAPARTMSPPVPGLREEGEARKRAEERARAAEERLSVLQEQYRKTLDDLQTYQRAPREPTVVTDPRMEERALRAEGQLAAMQQQVATLTTERAQLARDLEQASRHLPDGDTELLLRAAERETHTLRGELQEARVERDAVRRELDDIRSNAGSSASLRTDLDATNVELVSARDQLASAHGELDRATRELEDARVELRALRNEEQRAAMLEDELRAAKAEIESFRASHRADLVERESEFEDKVRTAREEFQRQLEEMETTYRSQVEQREAELAGRIAAAEGAAHQATTQFDELRSELEAAKAEASSREQRLMQASDEMAGKRSEVAALEAEIKERSLAVQQARKETEDLRRSLVSLQADLARTDASVGVKDEELTSAVARATTAEAALETAQREREAYAGRTEKLTAMLESAAAENAELNRRLQEVESRRQLELAEDEGRSEIDDLLRVTQERLAGQTEKLMAAEDRVRTLESELADATDRVEIAEGELRTHQMSEALREIRDPEHLHETADQPVHDDRRATTPFVRELSMDARKSISRINGIAQLLKHKRDTKEQNQLLKQLAANMRRLDHAVADMADAERLVRGTVEMQLRKIDLEALVERVVDESEIASDHEVRVIAEGVAVRVDGARVEQLLAGLLRNSAERTPSGRAITIRLQGHDGGALLSVEDTETSTDASMSPVARRLAELHGGWAKVESRDGGGSAFRVYLPDGGTPVPAAAEPEPAERDLAPELRIVVDDTVPEQRLEPTGEQILAQELRRLASEQPTESERGGRRSRAKR